MVIPDQQQGTQLRWITVEVSCVPVLNSVDLSRLPRHGQLQIPSLASPQSPNGE